MEQIKNDADENVNSIKFVISTNYREYFKCNFFTSIIHDMIQRRRIICPRCEGIKVKDICIYKVEKDTVLEAFYRSCHKTKSFYLSFRFIRISNVNANF